MKPKHYSYFSFLFISLTFTGFGSCTEVPEAKQSALDLSQGTWVDLSYPFDQNTIYWPTDTQEFKIDTVAFGTTEQDYFYSAFSFCSAEHGGTHLDAPIHFSADKKSVEALGLDQLIGQAVVMDVSEMALQDRDYLVSVADVMNWESKYGKIPSRSILLLRTGYGQYWPDRAEYLGTAELGPEAIPFLHFPGLDPVAASWLTENRDIKAIGLDTPSIDYGQSTDFKTHRVLFSQDIPAFENLANLDQLPATGTWVIALPMPISGGSGAPLRAVAWIP